MKQELKTILLSPQFWLAGIIFFLSFFGYSLPRWFQSGPPEYKDSALQLSIGSIYFGGIQLILYFCSALVGATRQAEETRGGMARWRSLRLGLGGYVLRKLTATGLAAGLMMGGAFMAQAALWNLVGLPVDPVKYAGHYNFYSPDTLYYGWYTAAHALPIYLSTALGLALCGAGVAWLSMAVAVWMQDKLLAVVMPAMLISIYQGGFFREAFGLYVPFFSDLFNDGLTASVWLRAFIALGVMMALSAAAYRLGLERRVRHA